MRYVSPFSFITFNDKQRELSSKDIFLAKRKLLSEFELQGSSTIDVGGTQLTKNDVINLFNQFEKEDSVNYHLIVASDKILSFFLEHHQIEYREKFLLDKESLSSEFLAWISPYSKEAFVDCSTHAFRQQDVYTFSTLMANPRYLSANDEAEIWEPLHNQLQMLTERVKNISDTESHLGNQPVIGDFSSTALIGILKKLPEDRFYAQINEYAFELMRMSVGVFNKMDRNLAVYIIEAGLSLPISEEVRIQLNREKEEMNGVNEKADSGQNGGQPASLWAIVRVVLFIVYVLFKISTCNQGSGYSSGYNSNYNISPYYGTDYSKDRNQQTAEDYIENMNIKTKAQSLNPDLDSAIISFLRGIQDMHHDTTAIAKKKKLATGTDPYNNIWKTPSFKKTFAEKEVIISRKQDADAHYPEPIRYTKFKINNTSSFTAIVIVNRGDSVFSKFINAESSCTVPLFKDAVAKIYVYAGRGFVSGNGSALKISSQNNKLSIALPYLFSKSSVNNKDLMTKPIAVKAANSSSCLTIENHEYAGATAKFKLDSSTE